MAALDNNSFLTDVLKKEVRRELWAWIKLHQNDEVFHVKIWIISKTIYWRDLEGALQRFLGPEPLPE